MVSYIYELIKAEIVSRIYTNNCNVIACQPRILALDKIRHIRTALLSVNSRIIYESSHEIKIKKSNHESAPGLLLSNNSNGIDEEKKKWGKGIKFYRVFSVEEKTPV